MANISSESRYIEGRNDYFSHIKEEHKLNERDLYYSPSNKYMLEIEHYVFLEGYYRYSCTLGTLTNLSSNESIKIKRNFRDFLFEWIEKDEQEFLLCGQDYQGYSIVDLENLKLYDFVPEEAYEGLGFCWANVEHEGDKLIVEGCIWAYPYERIVYDFSSPLSLPYPELHRELIN